VATLVVARHEIPLLHLVPGDSQARDAKAVFL